VNYPRFELKVVVVVKRHAMRAQQSGTSVMRSARSMVIARNMDVDYIYLGLDLLDTPE
jgi:hypothetical protein